MTDSQKLDLLLSEVKEVKTDVRTLKDDVQALKKDVSTLNKRVSTLEEKVISLEEKVSSLDGKVSSLDGKVSSLDGKVSTLEGKVDKLTQRTDTIEDNIVHINLVLENEIRVNIQRVAEGHLDLSRNFHEAMKPNEEVEMLALRVGMLESDMRKVKAKLA